MDSLPVTIDEVIQRLDEIVAWAKANESRLGYFAALYNRVTNRVRDGIAKDEFDDGPRMARLDVEFANRYLDAFGRYQAGQPPTQAWRVAFESAARPTVAALGHLLLGMNAHIGLDLGVAAASICPGAAIAGLRGDFDRINTILGSLVSVVEAECLQADPALRLPVAIAGRLVQPLTMKLMVGARDSAWAFASSLAPLDATAQAAPLAARDAEISSLGQDLVEKDPLFRLLHIGEVSSVSALVAIFAQGEHYIGGTGGPGGTA